MPSGRNWLSNRGRATLAILGCTVGAGALPAPASANWWPSPPSTLPTSLSVVWNGGIPEPTAGNSGTPTFALTVRPINPFPNASGSWNVVGNAPGLSVHATVMNNGNVLLAEGSGNNPQQFAAGTFNVWIWNPTSGTFTKVPQLPTDLFCGGHALLPDGRILFLGGTSSYPSEYHGFLGTKASYIFDPSTGTFAHQPDMQYARWYPTALEQGDGSILGVSGLDDKNSSVVTNAEVFHPNTSSWSTLGGSINFPTYPHLTLLANGDAFFSGSAAGNSNSHAPGVWSPLTNAFTNADWLQDSDRRDQAATILMPPAQDQKIAVFGGGPSIYTSVATPHVDIYNAANPSGVTHSIGWPLAAPKMHVLGVILPDETVFETGGSLQFAQYPVAEAAIYHPGGGYWTSMNPPSVPRSYHSEAILLPTGQVATLGSNPRGFAPETRIEVFSPPYMFNGQRPSITAGPQQVTYGGTFAAHVTMAAGATIRRFVLVHPASVTHSDDPNQRLVELPFTGANADYNVTVPANPNLTPPGWYMMFADDNAGRPSVAWWVRVS